ncbi:biofilm PGA synthesis protein PgaA [Geoalkalibacter ferrihydriticus]|uniref:PgaA membrane beta barrel domain-containing protein n=2 Tax=Geoalkalibacter ferrihydriticus TaxID=392333 RepID=A0A0C2DWY3_9BACT|nr:poly-beta-1,6 N-acetyl-D-glucosamine export porin PgaA [Geoalkalibacter ferrihydriticus]KIH77979.1 hypothetical protein GFER_05075 [Geoalkalibacter ferrihydriticus DSM 17813]SDM34451.1 biofilm PGA synthesis protein PgaA [Geoalkalibacter ferrihydriticus]
MIRLCLAALIFFLLPQGLHARWDSGLLQAQADRNGGPARIKGAGENIAQTLGDEVVLRDFTQAHQQAVRLAREDRLDEALRIFGDLYAANPSNPGLLYDYLTVLGWAEYDIEVVVLSESLALEQAPAYVLEAVGKALRNTRRFDAAADLYAGARERFPGHVDFAKGEVYALAEAGHFAQAQRQLEVLRRAYPEERWPLHLGIYVAELQGDFLSVLDLSQQLLEHDPADETALRGRIFALAILGAAHRARHFAAQQPHLLSDEEWQRLHTDQASHEVRWGALPPPAESLRFVQTDEALTRIADNLEALDETRPAAQPFALQSRYDRLVALRDRVLMADAVAQYQELIAVDAPIPGYALEAAGDAFLYLQQPEQARDLYLQVLNAGEGDNDTRLALFYAYIELNDFTSAYALVDALQAEQPVWLAPGGSNLPAANPERLDADVAAALARVFAHDFREGQKRFEWMQARAPRNPDLLRELGNVYVMRGWPRRAQQTYEDGLRIKSDHLGLQAGLADTRLQLHEYDLAEAEIAALYARAPENLQIQRLQHRWDLHRMRELRAFASVADSSGAGPGEQELRLGSTLFSSPFLTHYRLFADAFWSRGDFPEGRGTYQRYGGGLEYRGREFIGTAALSINHSDGGDPGLALAGTWHPDDHWSLPFSLELFSQDTPLRALRNGVHADAASLGVDYRFSELRRLGLGGQFMDFSDGNQRTRLSGYARQRLITRPMYKLDGQVDLGVSRNSRSDVPYFSPAQDLYAALTLDNDWLLYRRYSRTFGHRLAVSAGIYGQQDFGTRPTASLLYEHNWQRDERFQLAYGAVLSRRAYDGQGETGTEYYLRLGWRL